MAGKPDLSIVLPCYNESRNIPIVVGRLSGFWPEVKFELILVNNGSTDNSVVVLEEIAKKYGDFVRVVTIEKNIGYGYGILTGLKEAKADVLAYSHADVQTPPEDIIKAYNIFKENHSVQSGVLVKGLRINRQKQQQFFTRYLSRITTVILGQRMEDINGQPKVFPRVLLEQLAIPPKDFSFDVYIMYISRLIGLKLITFPVDFGNRIHGKSNWSSSFMKKYKTIFNYLISILKMGIRHRLFRKTISHMKKPYFLNRPFCGNEKHAFSSPQTIAKLRKDFLEGKHSNLEYVMRNRFLWMNSYIEQEQKGIEVGCGAGLSRLYINSKNFMLTDVEPHPWVEKKVDALNMPFGDSSLDYIISSNMIHHLAQPHKFFCECSRVLKNRGKLIIQEVNASFLLRLMMVILKHESYSYDVNVFDRNAICNNPKDPWSSNDAVPNMLFDNKEMFEISFPFKIIHDSHTECLIWPLSGGVAGLVKTISFPKILLKAIDKFDRLLIAVSKNTFALQRQMVLENVK